MTRVSHRWRKNSQTASQFEPKSGVTVNFTITKDSLQSNSPTPPSGYIYKFEESAPRLSHLQTDSDSQK